jgi:hypothetical protein
MKFREQHVRMFSEHLGYCSLKQRRGLETKNQGDKCGVLIKEAAKK